MRSTAWSEAGANRLEEVLPLQFLAAGSPSVFRAPTPGQPRATQLPAAACPASLWHLLCAPLCACLRELEHTCVPSMCMLAHVCACVHVPSMCVLAWICVRVCVRACVRQHTLPPGACAGERDADGETHSNDVSWCI